MDNTLFILDLYNQHPKTLPGDYNKLFPTSHIFLQKQRGRLARYVFEANNLENVLKFISLKKIFRWSICYIDPEEEQGNPTIVLYNRIA